MLIVAALTSDFFHYVAGTLAWGIYRRRKELMTASGDAKFLAPKWINWPTLFFFWLKIGTIASAYTLLFKFLIQQLS